MIIRVKTHDKVVAEIRLYTADFAVEVINNEESTKAISEGGSEEKEEAGLAERLHDRVESMESEQPEQPDKFEDKFDEDIDVSIDMPEEEEEEISGIQREEEETVAEQGEDTSGDISKALEEINKLIS